MRVEFLEDCLMIIPKTDFEQSVLRRHLGGKITGFHKHGLSVSDYIGLKIYTKDKRSQNE